MSSKRLNSVKEIAKKLKISIKLVNEVFSELEKQTDEELNKSKKVKLLNYGTLKIVKQKSQTRMNPKTKQKVDVPEKYVVKFILSHKYKKN